MATGLKALPFSFGAHFLALIAAIMVLVWCIHFRGGLAWEAENKNLIFNIHPVLMLIGFIILGGEAIMSYKSFPLEKQVKKKIHLVLHAIALILGIIGIYTAFKNHNESNIPNMYSLHSWVGIGAITLYGIQSPCLRQSHGEWANLQSVVLQEGRPMRANPLCFHKLCRPYVLIAIQHSPQSGFMALWCSSTLEVVLKSDAIHFPGMCFLECLYMSQLLQMPV
ncbi:transmembrane ascorbate ferrireductase 1 isoform X2 [Capsicum annuum]|uniref:transmembrane ascorbate ferrireductase 1 isoform X2 n=1 Tax=Capsicum annuum TaxID=4072 RepID=UPI001FB054AE|nr:transmembrane ascorbate ferrireductase 1 isoform X2 [Capsicum annuum]